MGLKHFLFILSISLLQFTFAQTGSIKGFVYNDETGEPIIFTNVYFEGTTIGVATDINGYYAINKVPEGQYNLVCTYIGFDTAKVAVNIKSNEIISQDLYLKEGGIQLKSIVINGEKQKAQKTVQVSTIKISTDDIKKLPSIGGEADIAQYLQVVPGAVFSGEQGGQLYIRGGSPIQNKVLLDGMTIYNPFHSMGVFSVFETDIIKNTDVYTGGFNAQYGGRLSAIVDITTKDGNKNKMSGKVAANSFMVKTLLEGPLYKGTEDNPTTLTYVLTGKQSIIDQTDNLLYSSLIDSLPYNFRDLYGKVALKSKTGSKLNVFGFNFNDGVKFQNNDLGWNTFGYGMNYVLIPNNSTTKISGSFTNSKYNSSLAVDDQVTRSSYIGGFNYNMGFTYYLENDEEFNYGFDVSGEQMAYEFLNPYNVTIDIPNNTTDIGLFFRYKMKRGKSLIEPGLRVIRYGKLRNNSVEPRLGYKLNITDNLRFKLAAGIYSQSLIAAISDRDVVNLFSGFLFAPSSQLLDIAGNPTQHRLQKANHLITGFEKNIGNNLTINWEAYYKLYTQLININRDKRDPADSDYMIEEGDAYGTDILIKYKKGFYSFWTTYSLSYVTREDANQVYYTNFDRRHNLNVVATANLGSDKTWEISAKWNLGSGFPFTQIENYYPTISNGNSLGFDYISGDPTLGINYGPLNGGRLPYFHRLDFSIKKLFYIGEDGKLETTLSVTNAYNRDNIFYYNAITNERVNQLPLIPSLGINWQF